MGNRAGIKLTYHGRLRQRTYIVAIYMLVSVLAAVYFGAFEKVKNYVTQTASH